MEDKKQGLPVEGGDKKKRFPFWLLAILICILLILPLLCLLGDFFYGRTTVEEGEEKVEILEKEVDVVSEEPSFLIEAIEIKDFLTSCMLDTSLEEGGFEFSYTRVDPRTEFVGMEWFNDEQEVELIKEYYSLSVYLTDCLSKDCFLGEDDSDRQSNIKGCLHKLEEFFLPKGFSLNEPNFHAFEKDSFMCSIRGYRIMCGNYDSISTLLEVKEIYKFLDAHNNFPWDYQKGIEILNIEDNYALLSHSYQGGKVLVKNSDGWAEVSISPDFYMSNWAWDCQELFDAEVPTSLFDYEYTEHGDVVPSNCLLYLTDEEVDYGYNYKDFYLDNL